MTDAVPPTENKKTGSLVWFTEKVLPGLLSGLLVSIGFWLVGTTDAVVSRISFAIGQTWVPDGALLLVAPNVQCPERWEELGLVLMGRDRNRDGNFVRDFGPPLGRYTVQDWEQLQAKACIKR